MRITWTGDISGLDLKPTWEVERIRIHTVKSMQQPDGSRKDTSVLVIMPNEEQLRTLRREFGDCDMNMLGNVVIPLYPNAVLWVWKAPKGYERSIKDGTYTAFEISDSVSPDTPET